MRAKNLSSRNSLHQRQSCSATLDFRLKTTPVRLLKATLWQLRGSPACQPGLFAWGGARFVLLFPHHAAACWNAKVKATVGDDRLARGSENPRGSENRGQPRAVRHVRADREREPSGPIGCVEHNDQCLQGMCRAKAYCWSTAYSCVKCPSRSTGWVCRKATAARKYSSISRSQDSSSCQGKGQRAS